MASSSKQSLTVAQFCAKYGIDRSTFYRNLKKKAMPRVIKVGAATRILVVDEEEWLAKQRSEK